MKFLPFLLIQLLMLIASALHADIRELHIIQTADLHAQFRPSQNHGGILKAATLIRQLRQSLAPENCLLIDCGDNTQGSLAASLSKGKAGMVPLRILKYDAWIPGNHEFDYGLDNFRTLADSARDILLCANISIRGTQSYTPWKMFHKNGLRIAVIGLSPVFQPFWMLPSDATELSVTPGADVLRNLLPEIFRLRPHAVIVAAHQGWFRGKDPRNVNEISALAEAFPEIDLFLGAHTHRLMPGNCIGIRSWYCQPAAQATNIGLVTLKIDTEKCCVVSASSWTPSVDDELPDDPELRCALEPFLQQEDVEAAKIVAPAPAEIISAQGIPGVNCPTSELLAAAVAKTVHADVVFHGKLTKIPLLPQPLTGKALAEFIPYDNTIVTAELTISEIEDILNEQWKFRKHYSYSGIYGAHAVLDTGRLRIVSVSSLHDDIPSPNSRIRVAFNSHAAAGSGRYDILRTIISQSQANASDSGMTVRNALTDYLSLHPGIRVKPTQWIEYK